MSTSSWKNLRTDPVVLSTVVIALASVLNFFVAVLLWVATARTTELAKKSFEAGYRPYIGTEKINLNRDEQKHAVEFSVTVKNFGNVPAEGDLQWKTFLNGQEMPAIHVRRAPSFFFPGQETVVGPSGVRDGVFDSVMNGTSVLEFCLSATYEGVKGTSYRYSEKHRYEPNLNTFFAEGSCEPAQ